MGFVTYRGIKVSAKWMVFLGAAGVAIALVLSLWGFFRPGPGGSILLAFNPANASSRSGLYLAVIFSIFAFNGWESVAPLAEESENPRQNLPRAILISILVMGVFLVLGSWGIWRAGVPDKLPGFINSRENPTFVLARGYWGGRLGDCAPGLTQFRYRGSDRRQQRGYSCLVRHGAIRVPCRELWRRYIPNTRPLSMESSSRSCSRLPSGWGLGWWIGPEKEFEFMGTLLTFALILTFSAANLGVFLYYFRERRDEFNVVLHAIFPLLGTVALFFVAYSSLRPGRRLR